MCVPVRTHLGKVRPTAWGKWCHSVRVFLCESQSAYVCMREREREMFVCEGWGGGALPLCQGRNIGRAADLPKKWQGLCGSPLAFSVGGGTGLLRGAGVEPVAPVVVGGARSSPGVPDAPSPWPTAGAQAAKARSRRPRMAGVGAAAAGGSSLPAGSAQPPAPSCSLRPPTARLQA